MKTIIDLSYNEAKEFLLARMTKVKEIAETK
jgi:hypothetical protein